MRIPPKRGAATAEEVRRLFDYDPETGLLTRRCSVSSNTRSGDLVGAAERSGHLAFSLFNRNVRVHRVVWLWMTGADPARGLFIDHADGDRANNRWSNLRLATNSQNSANARRRVTNRSGFKGVIREPGSRRWRATITKDRKQIELGHFDTPEAAHAAYCAAARELHGEFARAE